MLVSSVLLPGRDNPARWCHACFFAAASVDGQLCVFSIYLCKYEVRHPTILRSS